MSGQVLASRSSFSATASRMNAARRFGPARASKRAIMSASKRTRVVLVSESRLSGGRPIRGALSDTDKSATGILFPISLIDYVTNIAYISNIGNGAIAMTKAQTNILEALRGQITARRPWLRLSVLNCYDGRSVAALIRKGLVEVNLEYGVRA